MCLRVQCKTDTPTTATAKRNQEEVEEEHIHLMCNGMGQEGGSTGAQAKRERFASEGMIKEVAVVVATVAMDAPKPTDCSPAVDRLPSSSKVVTRTTFRIGVAFN